MTLSTPASIAASTTSSPYEAMTAVATVSSKFCAVGEGGVRQYAFIFQAPADPVQQALSAVCSRVNAYFAVLENVRRQQKVVMNSAPESGADGGPLMLLSRQQDELHSAARCDFHVLRCLYDEVLLPPLEICYLVALSEGLECVLRQLDVYQAELVQRLPGGIPVDGTGAGAGASFASLAAAAYSQPAALLCTQSSFRRSNMRGQGMQFVVELLSPAAGSVSVLGDVRIDLLAYSSDGYTLDAFSSDVKRRNSISPTDSSSSTLSTGSSPTAFTPTVPEPYSEFGESNTAYFLFRCPTGSNKRPVGVAFSVPVRIESPQGHVHEQSLELYYPRPSIIVTNSIQWMDAEGVLLRNEIFADRTEVSWARLCNALQGWLLDATRQPHLKAARILTKKDFAYLRQKAGLRSSNGNGNGNEGESEEQLFPVERWEAFWGFFGACAEKVRHQKSIMPMWCRGLVYGMGAKAECAALLAGHEPGTFMIRFSDTCPGTFAVAFVGEDGGGGAIHHALIRDTDASGAKRGVLEFIHDVAEVRQILVVQRDWEGNDVTPRSMRLVPKEAVLQEFFTYKPPKPTPGYEEVAIPPRAFGVSRPLAPTAYSQPTRCVLSTNTKLTN